MTKNWYVLRVASNREDQVREALERKVKIENLGDLIETRVVDVVLSARGRVDRVHAETREVLPRTRAILTARYVGQLRGRVTARVEVDGVGRRSFRLRL